MVALCSGCNIIRSYAAFCIGVVAGFVYLGVEHLMIWFKIDDPLGSVTTHLGGGLVGVILTPFFMVKEYSGLDGIFYWKGRYKILKNLTLRFFQIYFTADFFTIIQN